MHVSWPDTRVLDSCGPPCPPELPRFERHVDVGAANLWSSAVRVPNDKKTPVGDIPHRRDRVS